MQTIDLRFTQSSIMAYTSQFNIQKTQSFGNNSLNSFMIYLNLEQKIYDKALIYQGTHTLNKAFIPFSLLLTNVPLF